MPAFENPRRTEEVRTALTVANIGPIEPAASFPLDHVTRVHCPAYVRFLQTAYEEWLSLGRSGDATPAVWTMRGIRPRQVSQSLDGRQAYYSFDVMTPVTAGTWAVSKGAADAALAGAHRIASGSDRSLFVLCRPPRHHAAYDCYGGYSFLNNDAVAAQYLLDEGAGSIAILDIDYRHGNGTQHIFYERQDVLYASIHADPSNEFPYFLGYADETGAGDGEGFNCNVPLQHGSGWQERGAALDDVTRRIETFDADVVVVSLGVDTLAGDPLGTFRLTADNYRRAGARIARMGKPALFIMEGGYATGSIGAAVVDVLNGFGNAAT